MSTKPPVPVDDFSSPIYAQEDPATAHDSAHEDPAHDSAGGDEPEYDLNDPSLLLQEIDADPTADAYAAPPPVADGFYRAKLKSMDVKNKKQETVKYNVQQDIDYSKGSPGVPLFLADGKTPKAYATMAIQAQIIEPGPFDGLFVFDRFVDTRTDRRTKAVKVMTILNVLKVPIPKPYTAKTLVELLLKALAGEPEVDIEVTWEGQASKEDSDAIKAAGAKVPRVKGMHRFPQVNGKYVADMMVDVAVYGKKVNVHAQPTVTGYFVAGSQTSKKKK